MESRGPEHREGRMREELLPYSDVLSTTPVVTHSDNPRSGEAKAGE